jgi:DNA-binding IclR family transcriptional regulator
MNATELDVLRALLRLARRRTPPSLEALVVRVGVEEPEVRNALRVLAWQGLVQRTPSGLGLSMHGLAVAVAYAKRPAAAANAKPKPKKATRAPLKRAA